MYVKVCLLLQACTFGDRATSQLGAKGGGEAPMVEPQDNLGLWRSQLSNALSWGCFKPSKIESMLKHFAQYLVDTIGEAGSLRV